jgi:hypothetical protein
MSFASQASDGKSEWKIVDVVGTISKSSTEKIKVATAKYGTTDYIMLQIWKISDDGKDIPTSKAISFKRTLLPELKEILGRIEDKVTLSADASKLWD